MPDAGEIGKLVSLLEGRLRQRGLKVATAESLTGGQLAAAFTAVPEASAVYTGGVVAYTPTVKQHVLGVPPAILGEHGVVSAECAAAMAAGGRVLCQADYGLATTGVAGPDPLDGHPVGTVFIAVAAAEGVVSEHLTLAGDRTAVQHESVLAVLRLLSQVLGELG